MVLEKSYLIEIVDVTPSDQEENVSTNALNLSLAEQLPNDIQHFLVGQKLPITNNIQKFL